MTATVLSAVLLAMGAQGDKKDAKWLTKYQEALQVAAKEGKPIVIDAGRKG